eukprot:scaffold32493_cov59-Attheya_sp.AAC.4
MEIRQLEDEPHFLCSGDVVVFYCSIGAGSGAHDIPEIMPAGCYPFIMVLFTIWNLIFPLRTRAPLWQAIWRVVTAPITSPKFFHTYVADVFTSMIQPTQYDTHGSTLSGKGKDIVVQVARGHNLFQHEHRHNTEGYRRVDFVPLHFNTGHNHKYKKQKEHVGWHVLAEVAVVSAAVIAISITSVIAAQRATRYAEGLTDSSGEL